MVDRKRMPIFVYTKKGNKTTKYKSYGKEWNYSKNVNR